MKVFQVWKSLPKYCKKFVPDVIDGETETSNLPYCIHYEDRDWTIRNFFRKAKEGEWITFVHNFLWVGKKRTYKGYTISKRIQNRPVSLFPRLS